MTDRLPLVIADEHVHVAVEGGGEEERLATGGRCVEDAPHRRQKSHIGHAIGLVHDDHVDVRKDDVARSHEILEPARARHRNIDGLAQRVALGAKAHAAVEGVNLEAPGLEERGKLCSDLSGELAGRCEHKTAWALRGAA
jgi:predicted metal-dependent hydrolase